MQRAAQRTVRQIASTSRRRSARHASSSAPLPISLEQASAQLIPPIPSVCIHPPTDPRLYRRLLRVHRYLPDDMRFMGDSYVKSEFRLTRNTDNPMHIIAFLTQWKKYLDEIEGSIPPSKSGEKVTKREIKWTGRKLDMDAMDKLSQEQVGQLYELMHATKDVWKTPEQLESDARSAEESEVIASTASKLPS